MDTMSIISELTLLVADLHCFSVKMAIYYAFLASLPGSNSTHRPLRFGALLPGMSVRLLVLFALCVQGSSQETFVCEGDGSRVLPSSSKNDDYCDCDTPGDGSDEPDTAACSHVTTG
jgi:hypothetical protein